MSNLLFAWRKARKHKTKKQDIIEFEKDVIGNLYKIYEELRDYTYKPKPLTTFILRDPKTRKISKSDFRDRILHHALCNIIEIIFDRSFIYDSCANRKGKGTLFALKRFEKYIRIVSKNNTHPCFVFKADIKHYFQEINHNILMDIISRKIADDKVLTLIRKILNNAEIGGGRRQSKIQDFTKGMPLGNLTSQFFANVYLNKLDYFIKHKLRAKYYIRYVDDFVILHSSKSQLIVWKKEIGNFLRNKLKLELHPEKSRIIPLSKGIDFVGFRNFYYYKLLRKRNVKSLYLKIDSYKKGEISKKKMLEIFQGWNAYAKWANSLKLRREVVKKIYSKIQSTV